MEIVLVLMLVAVGFMIRACRQGPSLPGYSWFDVPHASNRAERRRRW